MKRHGPAVGIVLLATFFAVAAILLTVVCAALIFPGSPLEAIWRLHPARRAVLMPYREVLAPGFLALVPVFVAAGIGCLRRREWGRRLALAIFLVNGAGDAVQLIMGRVIEGGVGVAAAGALVFALTRPSVRARFAR